MLVLFRILFDIFLKTKFLFKEFVSELATQTDRFFQICPKQIHQNQINIVLSS